MESFFGPSVPLTPAEQAAETDRLARVKQAEESAALILGYLLQGYERGELGFEEFCRLAHRALAAKDVPEYARRMWLGDCVSAAINMAPAKGTAGQKARPEWLCQLSADLCDIVREKEGLPLTRKLPKSSEHRVTAFERVAEILSMRGIPATAVTVEKSRADWKKHAASR